MATSSQTPTSWRALQDARQQNELSYQTTCSYQGLPDSSHIAMQATPDAVLVTATDIDVLAEWLFVQGGTVTTVDLPSGQTVWTLHTRTWSDSPKFPPVPVHLSVVMVTGESVIWEIEEATRTAREAVA
ncbi:hypothetical protein ACH5A3_21055 [Streptomyces echinatus]|uniref:hypothetical protein n=1 Tax=Streptomyces echinatus TaxID=67293 RepID=UPI0037BD2E45